MTLLETAVVDLLTLGGVGARFPSILGGLLYETSYTIKFFALIGVILVFGSINSVRDDLFDDKIV